MSGFRPGGLNLTEWRKPLDLVEALPPVQIRCERILVRDTQHLQQIEARVRQMRRHERGVVGRARWPHRRLLVAQTIEAVAEEHGIEAKNVGERRDSAIHLDSSPRSGHEPTAFARQHVYRARNVALARGRRLEPREVAKNFLLAAR